MTRSMQVWPTGTDYSRAVQTPSVSFADPELAAGRPGVNAMGMPLVASGQNAVVFLLETDVGQRAVRCFLTPPHEGAVRYAALEEHLVNTAPRALTAARWLPEGVSVGGRSWPVVVMPWVEGSPLNVAVEGMLDEPLRLRALATQWVEVMRGLQRAKVAHGDLQHGNVLVKPDGAIALVDLDGVWVPEIQVGPPAEFGHPNYQHPQRTTAHWGRWVDSFPGALIELGLRALAADSSLERFLHGENLLFSRGDLTAPHSSEVWGAVCTSPDAEVAALALMLRERCAGPIADVLVPYDDLLSGTTSVNEEHGLGADDTVARPTPTAAAVCDVAVAAPRVIEEDAWWVSAPGSAGVTAGVPPPSNMPATTSSDASRAVPASAADTSAAAAGKQKVQVGALVRLGQNMAVAGLVGGIVAGILGSRATGLVDEYVGEVGETIAFVLFIGLLLGGFGMATQALVGKNWRAAARRFAIGGAVGGVAALVALPLADTLVKSTAHVGLDGGNEVPLGGSMLMFMAVAACLGLALGALRSWQTGLLGLSAGLIGGAVGGAIFGGTVAKWDGTELDVKFLKPGTMIVVAIATGAIGLAIGGSVRIRRAASLTIIEGQNSGLEIAVEGSRATIGSGSACDLVLGGDSRVQPKHAVLHMDVSPPDLEPLGTVMRNGQQLAGRTPLASGDVVMVGGSFIRIEFKEAE